jgi:hypothetical protein
MGYQHFIEGLQGLEAAFVSFADWVSRKEPVVGHL